jgi:hypothetical protein
LPQCAKLIFVISSAADRSFISATTKKDCSLELVLSEVEGARNDKIQRKILRFAQDDNLAEQNIDRRR